MGNRGLKASNRRPFSEPFRTAQKRKASPAQQVRLWGKRQFTGEFDKRAVYPFLAMFLIALVVGGVVLYTGPLFHSYIRRQGPGGGGSGSYDPTTVLWQVTSGQSGTDFKTAGNNAVFGTTAFDACSGCKDVALTASSTIATEALTNSSINSLSQAVSKDLLLSFNFYLNGNPTVNIPFYYFLTINSTIPASQTTYNPLNDASVVFAIQVDCTATCTTPGARSFSYTTYIQHRPGDSLNSEIPGGVCTTTSSCYINTQSFGFVDPTADIVLMQQYLNYTGGTTKPASCGTWIDTPPNAGCSRLAIADVTGNGGAATTTATTANSVQPNLLSQPNYYFGIFASPNLGSQLVTLYDTGTYSSSGHICDNPSNNPVTTPCNVQSMEAGIVLLTSAAPVAPPPTIDTGGFFGPIIKALVSIGIFIAQNIINFLSYLYNIIAPLLTFVASIVGGVLVAIMNTLGGIFGDSTLGTQISTAFTNIVNYLTNIFTSAVAIWSNILTGLLNILNFIVKFLSITVSGGATLFAFVEGFFSTMTNFWSVFVGVWNQFMKFYIAGTFTIQYILVGWWIWGMYENFSLGLKEGLMESWLQPSQTFLLAFFKTGYWLLDEAYKFVVQLKQLIFGNRISPGTIAGNG